MLGYRSEEATTTTKRQVNSKSASHNFKMPKHKYMLVKRGELSTTIVHREPYLSETDTYTFRRCKCGQVWFLSSPRSNFLFYQSMANTIHVYSSVLIYWLVERLRDIPCISPGPALGDGMRDFT